MSSITDRLGDVFARFLLQTAMYEFIEARFHIFPDLYVISYAIYVGVKNTLTAYLFILHMSNFRPS